MITQKEIRISTQGRGTYDLSRQVQDVVAASGTITGICNIFVCHTSASLMLCENADPDVLRDMESFMQRVAPDGDPLFTHTAEGPDGVSLS